jgi:hypothetical protein
MDIPLSKSDYFRGVAKEARIRTRNRYFEQNPILTDGNFAMISRPALRRWLSVGNGPIRGVYSQPGSFDEALFVVSDTEWYRVARDGTKTLLQGGLQPDGFVSMAGTGSIGATPEFMFMADGSGLYVYLENGFAKGTISGTVANNDTVQVGTTYYKFTNAGVNVGAPAGTLLNPWLVALGATDALSWANLAAAFSANGTAGTQYSTALVAANPSIQVIAISATLVSVRATAVGALGNAVVTLEGGAGMAWTAGTLTGGGGPSVTQVQTPDDVGVISLGYIASYVVVVPAQDEGVNGQFYWIEPGETTIDALNFATAERAPDPILQVVVFVDQFWLPGSNTTEVWYFTGNFDSPVARLQGVTFDRGTWEGTAVQVKESMIVVDADGGVFQIAGGLKRISRPDIEERIRVAIAKFEATHP